MREIKKARFISIVIIVFILCGGIVISIMSHKRSNAQFHEELITNSKLISHAFDAADISKLMGSDSDLISPVYLKIKKRLTQIRETQENIRFVYIVKRNSAGAYIISADSEPISSPDYSPPGQVYTEAPPEYAKAFNEGISCVSKPYRDRWGKWVSALSPIYDDRTGEIVGLLGIDIDVEEKQKIIVWDLIPPISITLVFVLLTLLFSNIIYNTIRKKVQITASEAKIRKSEELFRSVIENMHELYFRTDLDGKFVLLSPSCESIFGPMNIIDISQIDYKLWMNSRESTKGVYDALLSQDEGVKFEVDVTTWQSEQKSFSISAYKLFDSKKQHIGYEGFAFDVTESKRNSEQVRKLLTEKEMLLKEVHHRIKNNMNSIASLLSLQSANIENPNAKAVLADARGRVLSLMTVYDKLYRSKDFHTIALNEYFEDVLSELETSYSNYLVRIKLIKSLMPVVVESNLSFQFGIILNELVTNAFKYAFNGELQGEISIELFKEKDVVWLIIRDNGKGLPSDFSLSGNLGFGLSLVLMLVEQFSGTIDFSSNNGAEFRISAPIDSK